MKEMRLIKSDVSKMKEEITKDVQELRDSITLNRHEGAEIQSAVGKKAWDLAKLIDFLGFSLVLIADYSLITSPSNMLFLLINFKSDKNFSNLSVRKSSSLFASPSRLITSDKS